MSKSILSQEYLKKILFYSPETGDFTWIAVRKGVKRHKRAGNINGHGYHNICIDGVNYRAHRLAFLYMTGEIPVYVDHINQVKIDNRWANLRSTTKSMNARNTKKYNTNTSGRVGVVWVPRYQKWLAQMVVNYKQLYLGRFEDIQDAINARKEAEIKYGFSESHGTSRSSETARDTNCTEEDVHPPSIRASRYAMS